MGNNGRCRPSRLLGLILLAITLTQGDGYRVVTQIGRGQHKSTHAALEIVLITWNEVHLLPYTVRFYQSRFPPGMLKITVYDNESTDGTQDLAHRLGCRVHSMKTNGSLSDSAYLRVKNEAWKSSSSDWVLMVDADEWVDVWPQDLAAYETANVTAVKTKGVYLVWPNDTVDLSNEPRGVWDIEQWDKSYKIPPVYQYDKPALYYKSAILETGMSPGGHKASPQGRIKWLSQTQTPSPRLYHAKYFNAKAMAARFGEYRSRMSVQNKDKKWGTHYAAASEIIETQFEYLRNLSRPLPWRVL